MIILKRTYFDYGTKGRIDIDDQTFYTLELPWKDNKRNISCIPEGVYNCFHYNSPHFGEVIHVENVKDRDYILFHVGNTTKDTRGCILVGSYFLKHRKDCLFLCESKNAFNKFLERIDNNTELKIIGE